MKKRELVKQAALIYQHPSIRREPTHTKVVTYHTAPFPFFNASSTSLMSLDLELQVKTGRLPESFL